MYVFIAAGCVLDTESDAMLSSGSMLMSSAGGSDDIMDESWLQRQLDVDERPLDAETSPNPLQVLHQCPLDLVNGSKTAFGNKSCHGDDASRASGNTDSAATFDRATGSSASVTGSSYTDKSDLDSLVQATSVKAKEEIRVSAITENGSEQNSQGLANNENDQSAVEEQVSTSESATEPHLRSADATEPDAEIQNALNLGVDEARTLSVDVDECQLSQFQSAELPPQTTTEFSTDRSEISLKDVEDVKQTESSCIDACEIDANSGVNTKTRMTDSKNIEDQTTTSTQRLQSSHKTSSTKTDFSSKPLVVVATKDKLETRSTTNPRSTGVVVLTLSKKRTSRGSADSEPPSNKNTLEKSKLKRENDKGQPNVVTKPSLKSTSTQKASDRVATIALTPPVAVGRRDATEKPSNQTKKPNQGAVANAATKEADKTPDDTENKNASGMKRITDKKKEPQNAEEKKAGDKVRETAPNKEASSSSRKSLVAKSNPGPEDEDKGVETQRGEMRAAIGKQRTKSTGSNPSVSGSVSSGTAAADRTVDKLPKDPSIAGNPGNPGNPRPVGDRATTSGESKDSSLPTKKLQQRSASSRTTAAASDTAAKTVTTALPGRGASQTAKTTQRADKSSNAAAGDSKTAKSSGKKHAKQSHIIILT